MILILVYERRKVIAATYIAVDDASSRGIMIIVYFIFDLTKSQHDTFNYILLLFVLL
jgi:hypothetical protein